MSSFFEYLNSDVESSHKQLGLDVLVHIVESGNIWSSIANNQFAKLSLECLQYLSEGLSFGDITDDIVYVVNWSSILEVD